MAQPAVNIKVCHFALGFPETTRGAMYANTELISISFLGSCYPRTWDPSRPWDHAEKLQVTTRAAPKAASKEQGRQCCKAPLYTHKPQLWVIFNCSSGEFSIPSQWANRQIPKAVGSIILPSHWGHSAEGTEWSQSLPSASGALVPVLEVLHQCDSDPWGGLSEIGFLSQCGLDQGTAFWYQLQFLCLICVRVELQRTLRWLGR